MDPCMFNSWLSEIQRNIFPNAKLEAVRRCPGYVSGSQLTQVVSLIPLHSDKVKAIQFLDGRMTVMTCFEAASILAAIPFPNDKLNALRCLAKVLSDANTPAGRTAILNAFPNFSDRSKADGIISAFHGSAAGCGVHMHHQPGHTAAAVGALAGGVLGAILGGIAAPPKPHPHQQHHHHHNPGPPPPTFPSGGYPGHGGPHGYPGSGMPPAGAVPGYPGSGFPPAGAVPGYPGSGMPPAGAVPGYPGPPAGGYPGYPGSGPPGYPPAGGYPGYPH